MDTFPYALFDRGEGNRITGTGKYVGEK